VEAPIASLADRHIPPEAATAPGHRLRRAERREQILAAATEAFAGSGFAATSLDDVAARAAISRAILYRHFASKADLYRAVLDRACARLAVVVGEGQYTPASVDALVEAAAEDPAGFRLLFHHAAREPEFREEMDRFHTTMVEVAYRQLAQTIPDQSWARWAAQLVPTVAVEAVIAWLDVGRGDRDEAAARIRQALAGVIQAAVAPVALSDAGDQAGRES
jgi:AcrR family transcriptional regulator